jgi:hypothetical protein
MAYQQNFAALDGTIMTLTIGNVTIPTGAVTPPLADDPFTTEEEADTDMFMPTRTQTGYVRLSSMDKSAWRAFIPGGTCDKPVTLTAGNAIVWQGYLQTGTYGMPFPAIYETVELPVICPLGALDSFDVENEWGTGHEMVTLSQMIYYIFSRLSGLTFTFHFQVGSSESVQAWLAYSVAWRNFLSESGGKLSSRFSCLGLLQELCKLFGWTCRVRGQGIYFTSITDSQRNSKFITCSLAALNTTGRVTFSDEAMSPLTLTDSMFASTNHQEEFIPGVKKVTVSSELNPYDVLIDLPYEEMYQEHKYDTPTAGPNIKRWRVYRDNEIWLLYRRNATGQETFENLDVAVNAYVESAIEGQPQCYGRFIVFDNDVEFDGSTPVPKAKYNWIKAFECFRSGEYGNRTSQIPLFSLTSKQACTIGYGVLWINGRCDIEADYSNAGIYRATCTLKIGNRYWNGSAWTTAASTFALEYMKDGIRDVQASGYTMADYEGLGIPVGPPLSGIVYFAVNDVQPLFPSEPDINGYFPLMDFQIGFVRSDEDQELNDISYTADGGAFPENIDVDTIFSTDKTRVAGSRTIRCQMGYGLLMSGNNVVQTAPYGSISNKKPEQRTADLIADYGSQVRRVLTLDLWSSQIGLGAGPVTPMSLEGTNYYPVAVSHNWRDDVSTVTLMEIATL